MLMSSKDAGSRGATPNPELVERAKRRRFTAQYKLQILTEAEACKESGELGAVLRRAGTIMHIRLCVPDDARENLAIINAAAES